MLRWICLVTFAGCATAPRPTTIPLTISAERAVTVPVVVDGTPLVFQLDTGASSSVITPATRERLHLARGKLTATTGAGGAIDNAESVILHDIVVGDRHVANLDVAVVDLGGALAGTTIDGVLGQDVLARFIGDIDLAAGTLVLHPLGSTAWRTGDLVAIPFTLDEGLLRVDASLDGTSVPAIVDLGASATVASTKAAPAARTADGVAGSAIGADGRATAVAMLPHAHVAVGPVDLGVGSIAVADLPVFGELHTADRPALILGMDRLGATRLVIDPTTKQLYIATRNLTPSRPVGSTSAPDDPTRSRR